MMASNILSRLLPSTTNSPSIYEDLRAHDEDTSDLEERAAMEIDEENLGGHYHDHDLQHADLFNAESRIESESTTFLPVKTKRRAEGRRGGNTAKPASVARSPRLLEEDGDDEVPASLLIEGDHAQPSIFQPNRNRNISTRPSRKDPIPGPSTRETRSAWDRAQAQQRLHHDNDPVTNTLPVPKPGLFTGNAKEMALWSWMNVTNLDHFMSDVYEYYRGCGIWCICFARALHLLTITFVTTFTTFLTQCVYYSKIRSAKEMDDIVVKQCTKKFSTSWNFLIWIISLYIIWQLILHLLDIRRLRQMQNFYLYLLEIPDSDMQTVTWQDVVIRVMELREHNPITREKTTAAVRKYLGTQSKERLDAHDIANRLMRRENYLIAMFNKEILDLTLPIPFLGSRQFFSRSVEWNLNQCILDFVFNENGQVKQLILKDTHRRALSNALRNRFIFAGFMNVLFAPVAVMYLLVVYFFRYFNEYQKNPASIGARQYTPLAEWKFREFNELPHLFEKRLNMSYPFASRYVDQFPKVKTVQMMRFVSFVAGAFLSVLAVFSIFDPELFLSFQVTNDRTVLFYLGLFGTIWAVSHGSIPEENEVFEPEYALRNVIEYTHYMPSHWKDHLHSDEVKKEFAELYKMKIIIFAEEVLSIIFTPFVLFFSLPQCSDRIIDFFREFTVHVDGVGYVCSFAVFNFTQKGRDNLTQGSGNPSEDLRNDYYSTKHGKMAMSYYGFLDNYVTNPKTGIPGHVPPGARQNFHPPPTFPGLMSPTLAADMQSSRLGRSERPRSRAPAASRTPRFPPTTMSPMPSILLDPRHQPSSSGFGGRSMQRRNSRSRYLPRRNIDAIEDAEEDGAVEAMETDISQESGGLGESRWETSPVRNKTDEEEEGAGADGGGVLGMLYRFQQKAQQADGRGGVHI